MLRYAIPEASGRFAVRDPREWQAMLASTDLPAHQRLAKSQVAPDWEAEFEAGLADLMALIENVARHP